MASGTRRQFLIPVFLGSAAALAAPAGPWSLDDLIRSGQELAEEHVDPKVLEALRKGEDPAVTRRLLDDLQQRFQGDYLVDVARMRETAETLLPVLEQLPATRPYAGWLRPRMDYFEVADQLEVQIPPPRPGQPAPPRTNPSAAQERQAWEVQVGRTPSPKGAATWVPRLKPLFRAQRVPQELVWVAEVESSFNPEARSPSGAVGLYQLMPATAQSLGLKLTPQDERRVGERNARAAAGYLRALYGRFKDWRLTLAAYNGGQGRVGDLLKSKRARTFDEISPHLPAETQLYVPKVEAVVQRREGRALTRLPAAG
ncbi:MAG: lytic transglycosylase domain-containing protein [Verrucomicrobia bacterium]|nr:lytic transglycosylase domain-containing protein [Verrucomicrobiota bacterium]